MKAVASLLILAMAIVLVYSDTKPARQLLVPSIDPVVVEGSESQEDDPDLGGPNAFGNADISASEETKRDKRFLDLLFGDKGRRHRGRDNGAYGGYGGGGYGGYGSGGYGGYGAYGGGRNNGYGYGGYGRG